MHLAHPDWLYHRLAAVGPTDELLAFIRSAAGPGVVPFAYDVDGETEAWYIRLVEDALRQPARRRISHTGCRRLAERLCEVGWEGAQLAQQAVEARLSDCPFDLHALRPVPWDVLARGFAHPDAIDWLWQHWGTTWPLRHVRPLRPAGEGWAVEFWSADWSPWPVLAVLRERFPGLTFQLEVSY